MTKTPEQVNLEDLIVEYAKSYYTGYAEVSDEEFDRLVDQLRKEYPNSELLTKPGWGYSPTKKTPHLFNLTIGGLRKVHNVNELSVTFTPEIVRLSPKLDGLSVVRYYVNGKCIKSITRGNGTVGKDVTSHLEKIVPISSSVLCPDTSTPFTGAIRGEIILDKETFSKFYDTGEDSCNARNVASGLLNRDELSTEDAQNLSFVAYKVEYSLNYEFKNIDEIDEFLSRISRNVCHQTFTDLSKDDFTNETLKKIYNYFCESQFGLDGVVLTIYRGQTEGRLDYEEVAYKFESESKVVTVKEVTWNVTRTGRIVPRIWFDPIELSGVSVRKCTGHNAKYIWDNCIGPGAKIKVTRSGEVIPYCIEVVEKAFVGQMPEVVGMYWEGADLKVDCEENYLPYRFFTVIGEEEGAGPALYQSILDALVLNNEEDLVNFGNMTYEECVEKLPRTISGDKTLEIAQKIIRKIKCDPVSPVTFLVACNIPGVSWKTFSKILKEYPDFLKDIKDDWIVESSDSLDKVSGVGYATRETILEYAQRVRKLMNIVNLEEAGAPQTDVEVRHVAITGKLSVKRSDFEKLLSSKGFEVSSINKETFCLITDNPFSGSSKNQKADKLGIKKMTEEEFRSLYLN